MALPTLKPLVLNPPNQGEGGFTGGNVGFPTLPTDPITPPPFTLPVASTSVGFLPTGGSGGSSGSSGGPTMNTGTGINISGGPLPGAVGQATSLLSSVTGGFSGLFGGSLLRIAFFLLGLICIIGAIYLYKPSVVTTPARAISDAVVTT